MEDLVSAAFWRGRRVFITGHTGFKGAWLALWLHHLGAQVCGYSLDPPTQPSFFVAARIAGLVEDLRGDIRDLPTLQHALATFAPQVVFHLAAQPLVLASYADPITTYTTNVIGTANVLEAIRHTPSVRAALCVTSDKCYSNPGHPHAFRESDPIASPIHGQDPYSSSKSCAELVTASWRHSFFNTPGAPAIATARAGNVIGGGDWAADRLLPDLLRSFIADRPALIRNPGAIRPWQHVLDPLHGYLLLAQHLLSPNAHQFARPFNFGPPPDAGQTVASLAARACRLWGNTARWQPAAHPATHAEAPTLTLDSTLAHTELGWRPHLSTAEALAWTIRWHQSFQSAGDMAPFTLGQIAAYEALLAR